MTVWNEIQDMPGEIFDIPMDWEAGVREHITLRPDDNIGEVCEWVEETHCPVDKEMEERILEIMLEEGNHHQLDSWDEV